MSTFLNVITIIWNHHGKRLQISTNMPGIGLVSHEMKSILKRFVKNPPVGMMHETKSVKVHYIFIRDMFTWRTRC